MIIIITSDTNISTSKIDAGGNSAFINHNITPSFHKCLHLLAIHFTMNIANIVP